MLNVIAPSLSLTAACGVFLVIVAFFALREKKQPAVEARKTCTACYIHILQSVQSTATTTQLSEIYDMADEFRSEFYGKMPIDDLNDFYNNILDEIKERRFELIMSKKVATAV